MSYLERINRASFPIYIFALVLILISGCEKTSTPEPVFESVKVERGLLEISVSGPGRIEPATQVQIRSEASGEILELAVDEGDSVAAGDLLVRVDPSLEARRMAGAQAEVQIVQAEIELNRLELEQAGKDLGRLKSLLPLGAVSRVEMEDMQRQKKILGRQRSSLNAQLKVANENLEQVRIRHDKATIYAPISGVVLERSVERGQVISSGVGDLGEGTLLMILADLDTLEVRAQMDEADIGRIEAGQEAVIEVEAYPGATFDGRVDRVLPKGRIERGITVFEVIVEITDHKRSRLKPLMSASVEIIIERAEDVLLVPLEALTRSGSTIGVYLMQAEQPLFRPVSLGRTSWENAEIIEGLTEGEQVLVGRIE